MVDEENIIKDLREHVLEMVQINDGMNKLIAALAIENGGTLTINKSTIVEMSLGLELKTISDPTQDHITIMVVDWYEYDTKMCLENRLETHEPHIWKDEDEAVYLCDGGW